MVVQKKIESEEKAGIADLAKKILLTGLGAVSMGDRLPKEAVNFILEQAEKKKDDFIDRLALEVSRFLEKLDVAQELRKALRGLELDLHATLRFSGKEFPEVKDSPISIKARRKI